MLKRKYLQKKRGIFKAQSINFVADVNLALSIVSGILMTIFLFQISSVGVLGRNGQIVLRMAYVSDIANVWWRNPVLRNVVEKNLRKQLVCQANVKVNILISHFLEYQCLNQVKELV